MFKKILKVVGIILASFVVVVGGTIGVFALTGGFKKPEIKITHLYFDDGVDGSTITEQTIYTLDDIKVKLKCEPKNATNQVVNVKYSDSYSSNDLGSSIIENQRTTVNIGEELDLKIAKDENGNNKSGPVTITFSTSIASIKLKLLVDASVPDDVLYFTGVSNSNLITSNGNSFRMASSASTQNIYLKSQMYNAFYYPSSETTNGQSSNLKNPNISYEYYDSSNILKESGALTGTAVKKANNITGEYEHYYQIPITPKYEGYIKLTAKMHRTYEIEKAYIDGEFDSLENEIRSGSNLEAVYAKLAKYNTFLNDYIKYFNTSEESNQFFMNNYSDSTGKIALNANANTIIESKNYIFSKASATVDVTGVYIQGITSTNESRHYNVFDTTRLSVGSINGLSTENMINPSSFDLQVELSDEQVANADFEKNRVLSTLNVAPYLFIRTANDDGTNIENEFSSIWPMDESKDIYVYGFDGNTPITDPTSELAVAQIGYLFRLGDRNNNIIDYLKISEYGLNGNNYWELTCNIPLIKEAGETQINKALYLQFSVEGVASLETSEIGTFYDYSRIYVDYNEYFDQNSLKQNLEFNKLYKMAINSSLKNVETTIGAPDEDETQLFASDYNTQTISIKSELEYKDKEYQSVMYFVESTSNSLEAGSTATKVFTTGKYNFVNMKGATSKFDGENLLIGERIPTYNVVNGKKEYYIEALNASADPVRVFAVIYLSDKDGNPIDNNGRKIKIDESDNATPTTLVVIAKTDITTSNIKKFTIDSYVDNMNFYTNNPEDITLEIDLTEFELPQEYQNPVTIIIPKGIINRNYDGLHYMTDYLEYPKGAREKIQSEIKKAITVKLLEKNKLTIYATNFELSGTVDSPIISDMQSVSEVKKYKDFYGKDIEANVSINNLANKTLALSNILRNFDDQFKLSAQGLSTVRKDKIIYSDTTPVMLEFTLMSVESGLSNNIYITEKDSSSTGIYSSSIEPGLSDLDYTNWAYFQTNKIEIIEYDMTDGIEKVNKLYAKYSAVSSQNPETFEPGKLTFQYKIDESTWSEYLWPVNEAGYPVDTNSHHYETNLINKEGNCNLEIIDLSQNIKEGENPEGTEIDKYASITAYYQNKIVIKEGGLSISTPTQVVTLKNNTTLNGYTYNAGEYFPVIGENFDIVVIGEKEYKKSSFDNQVCIFDENNVPIYIEEGAILPNGENYSPAKYFGNVNGIVYTDNGARLPFLQGEDFGVRYVSDEDGLYKYDTVNQKYVLAEGLYEGDRFTREVSEKGVVVYMAFSCNVLDFTKTEIFKFELVQNPIDLVVQNNEAIQCLRNDTDNVDNFGYISFMAGQEQIIKIGRAEGPSIYTVPLNDSNFFSHITYTIDSPDSGIRFRKISGGETLTKIDAGFKGDFYLFAPSNYTEKSTNITIEYKYKGQIITKKFKVVVTPNARFTHKNTVSTPDGNYNITLSANNEYSISELLTNNFDILNVQVKIYQGSTELNELILGESVALRGLDGSIERDKIELTIKLIIGGKETTLDSKLIIKINPTYVVEIGGNGKTILSGYDLWTDFIIMYTGTEYSEKVTDKSKYNEMLTIYNGTTPYVNGILTTNELTSESVKLTLKSGEKVIVDDLAIDIVKTNGYYSDSGSFGVQQNEDRTNINNLSSLNSNFTVEKLVDESFDVSKYVVFYTDIDIDVVLYAVLLDENGEIIDPSKFKVESGTKEYRIAIATHEGVKYSFVGDSGYTVTIVAA